MADTTFAAAAQPFSTCNTVAATVGSTNSGLTDACSRACVASLLSLGSRPDATLLRVSSLELARKKATILATLLATNRSSSVMAGAKGSMRAAPTASREGKGCASQNTICLQELTRPRAPTAGKYA